MQSQAKTVGKYLDELPEDRKEVINKLRKIIKENLPEGFTEEMSYGMIGFVVPHGRYPPGYHVSPDKPLPFVSLASQKNNVSLYHMGLYNDEELMKWFKKEFASRSELKLDMGKSCIRFRNPEKIPFDLIGELMQKITVDEWIRAYEKSIKKK